MALDKKLPYMLALSLTMSFSAANADRENLKGVQGSLLQDSNNNNLSESSFADLRFDSREELEDREEHEGRGGGRGYDHDGGGRGGGWGHGEGHEGQQGGHHGGHHGGNFGGNHGGPMPYPRPYPAPAPTPHPYPAPSPYPSPYPTPAPYPGNGGGYGPGQGGYRGQEQRIIQVRRRIFAEQMPLFMLAGIDNRYFGYVVQSVTVNTIGSAPGSQVALIVNGQREQSYFTATGSIYLLPRYQAVIGQVRDIQLSVMGLVDVESVVITLIR